MISTINSSIRADKLLQPGRKHASLLAGWSLAGELLRLTSVYQQWGGNTVQQNGPIEGLDVVKPLAKIAVYTDATENR
jgi:hypothetical protein